MHIALACENYKVFQKKGIEYRYGAQREKSLGKITESELNRKLKTSGIDILTEAITLYESYDNPTLVEFCDLRGFSPNGAYSERGILYMAFSEDEKAIKDFTKAIGHRKGKTYLVLGSPWERATYKSRGDVYQRMGEYKKAINDYTEAIRLKSTVPDYYWSRAAAYSALGLSEKAAQDRTKYEELKSK